MDTLKILDELQEQLEWVAMNKQAHNQVSGLFNMKRKQVKKELAQKRAERVGNKKSTGDGGQTDKSQSKNNGE